MALSENKKVPQDRKVGRGEKKRRLILRNP
jgi:hypothetical protein